ncbi:MAG: molybdopterin molybdenumtransferase MoeA [Desulfobacteraceae bacterium]|nr:MAG: molybdopterin molybdenumtransferase MoeA [Desulfobacteraceae bacterium]
MKDFFTVTPLEKVFAYIPAFPKTQPETIPLEIATGRVLARDIVSSEDIPGFARSTMDGYAVCAKSTFGATEGNPAYLTLCGAIPMGEAPTAPVRLGHATRISTGGMLPVGADCVVMLEYASEIDETTLEISKSVAPGTHVIFRGEDVSKGQAMLERGRKLRPQEIGLLAALGISSVSVYQKPVVGIISTGNEIVPIDSVPGPAQVRDVNSYSISSQIMEAGGRSRLFGIIRDDFAALLCTCKKALEQCDMVILSGGSSVGTRDLTIDVLNAFTDAEILVHGIPVSPGKPTILARVGSKAVWGLPGHITSAMVVFHRVVRPFVEHACGMTGGMAGGINFRGFLIPAKLSRNIASAQGRIDFVRVRLTETGDGLMAEPVLGKSGLIHTMVVADGLIEIDMNTEGLLEGTFVAVIPL